MVQYISRRRKGRSVHQKAQIRVLAHSPNRSHIAKSDGSKAVLETDSHGQEHLPTVTKPKHADTGSIHPDKKFGNLKRLYKNALQREQRAKLKVTQLRDVTDITCGQLSLISQERDDAERALEGLKRQESANMEEISIMRQHIHDLEQRIEQESKDLVYMSLKIDKQNDIIASVKARRRETYLAKEALRKKIGRRDYQEDIKADSTAPESYTHAYNLKDKSGVIRPEVRDMLRQLACKGVATEHASDIINIIAEGLGIQVVGSVSARSVARIMLEALIQARMQVAYELDQANYFTICGDGTSIKHQQYEAKSMYIQPGTDRDPNDHPGEKTFTDMHQPVLRTLGVQKAISHTAHDQLTGWIGAIDACCSTLTNSPTGHNMHITSKLVAPKLRGSLTDHAADQKLFQELLQKWKKITDRESRAVLALKDMSSEAQLSMLSNYLDTAAHQVVDWRALPIERQAALMHDAWLVLALQVGEKEFQKLSPESQFEVDFFAWTGCCMHKELNAVKGGASQMSCAWEEQGLTPPIALKNKFEATKSFKSSTEDRSTRGGVKLASLAGALFNNKDDKKGYQYTVDDFFRKTFGYSKRFPDTSNTRYGSYCDAATELIFHTETYIKLLETLRDSKGTPGFTNIESNVCYGLQDTSTLTELAVLALYAQSIGRPYMRRVRNGSINAMELGPFHDQVKAHCRAIIQNPDLLLSPAALATGTLDGENWDRPEVIYRIAYLAPSLPHLRSLLVAFFEGALKTWERFTAEFDQGSTIALATSEQRQSAWITPTNDTSEGALGQCRQMLRHAPTMTDNQRNARVMWQKNNTYQWSQKTLTDDDKKYIRHEARLLDASGVDQKIREEIEAALEERAAANRARKAKASLRKSAAKEKVDKVELLENADYEALGSLRVKELDLQIDKLRDLRDTHIPAKSTIRTKDGKVKALLAAFERRKLSDIDKNQIHIEFDTAFANNVADGSLRRDSSSSEDEEMCFDDEVVF